MPSGVFPNLLPMEPTEIDVYEAERKRRINRAELATDIAARLLLKIPSHSRRHNLFLMGDVFIQKIASWNEFVIVRSIGAECDQMPDLWMNSDSLAIFPKTNRELGFFVNNPQDPDIVEKIEGFELQGSFIARDVD